MDDVKYDIILDRFYSLNSAGEEIVKYMNSVYAPACNIQPFLIQQPILRYPVS